MQATGAINRLAGDFAPLQMHVSRMAGPIAGLGAAIVGMQLGLTLRRLNEETRLYTQGLYLMRSEQDKSISTASDFAEQFKGLNIGIHEFSEVFGEAAFGLRHQYVDVVGPAASQAQDALAELGYIGKETAKMTADYLEQRARQGVFERMQTQNLANRMEHLGNSTAYFAQVLGKSREEIQKSGDEFLRSTEAQYAIFSRFAHDGDDESLDNAMANLRQLESATSLFGDQVQGALLEGVTAVDFYQTPFYSEMMKIRDSGGAEIVGLIQDLRDGIGDELMDPQEITDRVLEAVASVEDDNQILGRLDQHGVSAGWMRELFMSAQLAEGTETDIIDAMNEGAEEATEHTAAMERIRSSVNEIVNMMSDSELAENILGYLRDGVEWGVNSMQNLSEMIGKENMNGFLLITGAILAFSNIFWSIGKFIYKGISGLLGFVFGKGKLGAMLMNTGRGLLSIIGRGGAVGIAVSVGAGLGHLLDKHFDLSNKVREFVGEDRFDAAMDSTFEALDFVVSRFPGSMGEQSRERLRDRDESGIARTYWPSAARMVPSATGFLSGMRSDDEQESDDEDASESESTTRGGRRVNAYPPGYELSNQERLAHQLMADGVPAENVPGGNPVERAWERHNRRQGQSPAREAEKPRPLSITELLAEQGMDVEDMSASDLSDMADEVDLSQFNIENMEELLHGDLGELKTVLVQLSQQTMQQTSHLRNIERELSTKGFFGD